MRQLFLAIAVLLSAGPTWAQSALELAPMPELAPLPEANAAPTAQEPRDIAPALAPLALPAEPSATADVGADTTSNKVATPIPLPRGAAPALAPLDDIMSASIARVTTVFEIRPGETLQAALSRWCTASGWTLVWKSSQDYRMEAPIHFPRGTSFKDAVRDTMGSIWRQDQGVRSTLYLRNNVLLVNEVKG